jgi:hypothetical protein
VDQESRTLEEVLADLIAVLLGDDLRVKKTDTILTPATEQTEAEEQQRIKPRAYYLTMVGVGRASSGCWGGGGGGGEWEERRTLAHGSGDGFYIAAAAV